MAVYQHNEFPVRISIKPNQFLYVQAAKFSSDQRFNNDDSVIEYYISTVTHLLMK